jgi:endonuclease V-like protein UPF0215 family
MRDLCNTVDYDALRKRALDPVILNATDMSRAAPTESPVRLHEQWAEVRRTLNEDLSQRIRSAVRAIASA